MEGLEGGRPEPAGRREDDEPARHDQQDGADSGGEQEAPAFEDPRHQGGRDAHREQAIRRAVPDEHASEREANGERDQLDRDEGRQTLDASSRSRGTCHRSLNFVDGVKTRQSQPARVRASLASVARASNWVRRLAGAVAGSTGWIKIASVGPNPEPDRMSCGSSWGAGGAAMNTSEASADAAPRRLVRALESEGPLPWVTPASASRYRSSDRAIAGVSAVPNRSPNPFRARRAPTLAAQETARSNAAACDRPRAASRLSRKTNPFARLLVSFCLIMSSPVRATEGQWIRRRSSPS